MMTIQPIPVVDVTPKAVDILKSTPLARAMEGFSVPTTLLRQYLVPQATDRVFRKLYVRDELIDKTGRLSIASDEIFANYQARIFESSYGGSTQLVMAGFSNDLGLPPITHALPYLVYIPPSPQDTPKAHRRGNSPLYNDTPDADIPLYYGKSDGYPYTWDWLYFQFYNNVHRIAHQLKWASRPYVFVVPLVRSFSDGLGVLGSAEVLEGVLLGIQKWYLDSRLGTSRSPDSGLKHVVLASFSIGTAILSTFLERNRDSSFVRTAVSDLIVLDPASGNPNQPSRIMEIAFSLQRSGVKLRLLLYSQDLHYALQAAPVIAKAGLTFNPGKQRLFVDPKLPDLVIAFLDPSVFGSNIIDPLHRDVHNTFPNLFIADGVRRSSLRFRMEDGQHVPEISFLDWVPH